MHGGRPDKNDLDKVSNEDLFWRRHLAKDGKTGKKDFEKPRILHFKVLKTITKKYILLADILPA